MQMLLFYFSLFQRMPVLAASAVDKVLTAIGIIIFFLALFHPELAKAIGAQWEGPSRWWALLPIGLTFLWGIMRINYEAWQTEVEKRKRAEARLSELQSQLQPKCEFYFSPTCCLHRRVGAVFIGVRNSSTATVQNVLVRIDIPSVGTRAKLLPWSGYDVGEPIQIDPSSPKFHHHFVLVEQVVDIQGERKMRMAHRDFDHIHLGVGAYEVVLSANWGKYHASTGPSHAQFVSRWRYCLGAATRFWNGGVGAPRSLSNVSRNQYGFWRLSYRNSNSSSYVGECFLPRADR